MTTDNRNYLMVAAIDFGTTYSGYAFSFRNDFKIDPLKIQSNPVWKSGSQQFMSNKTPTCLLLTKERKFRAFGFEAENLWVEALLDKEEDEFYYFHLFKMHLHNNKNITSDMPLEDITGTKTLPASLIFELSIEELIGHLMAEIKKQGAPVEPHEIQWVLTVPAIWTDTAKEFMRKSAEKAGIHRDMLLLALEPETASIYCQYLSIEKSKGSESAFTMTRKGTEYMVVDLGGGTADITVHKKVADDKLEEKHRAVGNDCGGTSVDRKYHNIFRDIVGSEAFDAFQREDPLAYLDFVREFESVKRTVNTAEKDKEKNKKKVNLTFPIASFNKISEQFHQKSFDDLLKESGHSGRITILSNKVRVDGDFMRGLFEPSINEIIGLMEQILAKKEAKNVSHILVVGGFSDCVLVQDAIRKKFGDKRRIIIPEDAGMTVLKGAVLFGHRPNYIDVRVMKCSYGLMTNLPWDERKYEKKYRALIGGQDRCDRIFSTIVSIDDAIMAGQTVKKEIFTMEPNQEDMELKVYTTDGLNPVYVDEPHCNFLCMKTFKFKETSSEKRYVDLEFTFGNTEIGFKAIDRRSGDVMEDFLELI